MPIVYNKAGSAGRPGFELRDNKTKAVHKKAASPDPPAPRPAAPPAPPPRAPAPPI